MRHLHPPAPDLTPDLERVFREVRAVRFALTGPWRFRFITLVDTTLTREAVMLLLTDVQKAALTIQPVDVKGNPAPVDGVPEWSVADDTLLDLLPAADGMSALLVAKGPIGTTQVNVTADADVGEGMTTIAGALDVQVVASQAVAVSISAGTPEAQ